MSAFQGEGQAKITCPVIRAPPRESKRLQKRFYFFKRLPQCAISEMALPDLEQP